MPDLHPHTAVPVATGHAHPLIASPLSRRSSQAFTAISEKGEFKETAALRKCVIRPIGKFQL